jgi:hypothetical protein
MNYLKLIVGINILCLFSCTSPSITEEYVINNQTDSQKRVYFDQTTFHNIEEGKSGTVYIGEGANGGGHPFLTDSVWIENENSIIVFYEKNYSEERNIFDINNNWESEVILDKKYESHYKYTYTITEEDFSSDK